MEPSRRQRLRAPKAPAPPLRPIPAWRWTAAAIGVFAAAAAGVTLWLLTIAGHAAPGTDLVNARLDAVRTGLAAGAGAGAATGIVLAFRRQHHQEVATVLTDADATERRITELYTKAVEQLGSDKAPVRLGGLYALERLAQDNPGHRQTIVNVICAYLRMPFLPAPPAALPSTGPGAADPAPGAAAAAPADSGDIWQQEKQVRLTAQRLLTDHLRRRSPADPEVSRFWPHDSPVSIDLTGATLIDFSLDQAALNAADFSGATFIGGAGFDGATFTAHARFGRATFASHVRFGGATFTGGAGFDNVIFTGGARFEDATFTRAAVFADVTFTSIARFDNVTFASTAQFGGATFTGSAVFDGATFTGEAVFARATFTGDARFNDATFTGDAAFVRATFTAHVRFGKATFTGGARFDDATFTGGLPSFTRSRVLAPGAHHIWPPGWQVRDLGDGVHTVAAVASDDPSQ